MKIVCDACSAKYSIADEKVRGKVFKIRCKKCSNIIVVRGVAEEAEPAPGFDHKETHVFNYGNYDDAGTETAQGAAEEAAWHVVIDQEQIGPMTAAELRDRFARGEIDGETYTWREGFDDWERLASLDAFSDLFAAGASASAPAPAADDGMAGLFGGPAVEDTAAAQSDPADLFTAQTGVGDVIGSGGPVADPGQPAAGAPMADSLFGGGGQPAAAAGGGAAPAGGGDLQIASQLTGQRSENSVLFSLNNLASLASDSPKQQVPQPSASPAGNAGGVSEGSGLIDIRSMASVYLGERSSAPQQASGSADDLPMFSSGSFEAASPVLLPATTSSAPNNRLIYILMAVIGVLVLAATVLVVYVVKHSGSAKPAVASTNTPGASATDPNAAGAGASGAAAAAAGKSAPTAPAHAAGTATDPGSAAAKQGQPKSPASAGGGGSSPSAPAATAHSGSTSGQHHRTHSHSRRGHSHGGHSHSRSQASPVPAPSHPSSSSSGGGCDEVTCLVSPNKPCCRKYHHGGSSGGGHASSHSNLPTSPSRGNVLHGIGRVKGRVMSCGGHGMVTAHIRIAPSGRVSGVSVSGASGGVASCVKRAVRHAHFERTQDGLSVNYPFVFR